MIMRYINLHLHYICCVQNKMLLPYLFLRFGGKPSALPSFVLKLVSRPPQSVLLHRQALTVLLNRWTACLTGSSILLLKLTFSPVPFPRNLSLSLTD